VKLRSIDIRRLPGIETPLRLDALPDGVIVISGPNASGKSSLLRALRHLLAPRPDDPRELDLTAEFDQAAAVGPQHWRVTRLGTAVAWFTRPAGEHVAWAASEGPPGLPDRDALEACFLQVDNLLDISQRDTRFLERFKRDVAGGFDLAALASAHGPFVTQPGVDRTAARECLNAEAALAAAQGRNQALVHERARLPQLDAAIAAAEQAQQTVLRCKAALNLLRAQRERQIAEQALARFPERMEGTPAASELTALEAAHTDALARCERSRVELGQAQARLVGTGLDPASMPDTRRARGWLRELLQADQECASAQRACERTLAVLNQRERQLGLSVTQFDAASVSTPPSHSTRPDANWLHAVEQAAATLHRADQILHQASAAEQVARAQAVDAAARQRLFEQGWRREVMGIALLGLAGAGGVIGGLWVGHGLVVGAPLLLLIPAAWLLSSHLGRRTPDAREHSQQSALREEAERGRAVAQNTLVSLAADAGLGTSEPLLAWSTEQLARQWHDQSAALEQFLAESTALQAQRDKRNRLIDTLSHFLGVATPVRPTTDELGSRLDALDERVNAAIAALQAQSLIQGRLGQEQVDAAHAEQALLAVYARCGLDAHAREALLERSALHPEWLHAREQLAQARHAEQTRLAEFDDPDGSLGPLVDAGDPNAIDSRRAEASQAAEQLASHISERQDIRTRIRETERSAPLDAARGHRDRLLEALERRREARLGAELGRWLLDSLAEENRLTHQPQAISNANRLFRSFTHDQFALEFDGGGAPAARHVPSQQRRALDELSVGTRMQLLIALRVAWVRTREGDAGPHLPLFLDEALTTTDPLRFQAIAAALHGLSARDQRQVFYLTAQAEDGERWRAAMASSHAPHAIRLPDPLGGASTGTDDVAPELPEPLAIPRPDGPYPSAYARALRVPPIDPEQGCNRIHPFHILRDDLDLLFRLLSDHRIQTLGQLRSLLERRGAVALGTATRTRLELRARVAEDWLRYWRIGRGRRLEATTLHSSPVAGWASLPALCERVEREAGDARRFIASLETDPIPLIGAQRRETIRSWLIEEGHLDQQSPLDAEERLRRLLDHYPQDAAREVREVVQSLDVGSGQQSGD